MVYSIFNAIDLQLSCRQILTDSTPQCLNATAQCLCSSTSFQTEAAHCIKTSCTSEQDQEQAYSFAAQVCAQAGVTLPSFDQIGETSGAKSVRVGFGAVVGVVLGGILFVGGLL